MANSLGAGMLSKQEIPRGFLKPEQENPSNVLLATGLCPEHSQIGCSTEKRGQQLL